MFIDPWGLFKNSWAHMALCNSIDTREKYYAFVANAMAKEAGIPHLGITHDMFKGISPSIAFDFSVVYVNLAVYEHENKDDRAKLNIIHNVRTGLLNDVSKNIAPGTNSQFITQMRFGSPDMAAFAFMLTYYPLSMSHKLEYGAAIEHSNAAFRLTGINKSARDNPHTVDISINLNVHSTIHTHWQDIQNPNFSLQDYDKTTTQFMYVVTHQGHIFYSEKTTVNPHRNGWSIGIRRFPQ
jgi:hypothetical protein